jgi:hypothetical protein
MVVEEKGKTVIIILKEKKDLSAKYAKGECVMAVGRRDKDNPAIFHAEKIGECDR